MGKSVIATAALDGLCRRKNVLPYTLNFSAQTAALETQLQIEDKLEKKRKTRWVPGAWGLGPGAWGLGHACPWEQEGKLAKKPEARWVPGAWGVVACMPLGLHAGSLGPGDAGASASRQAYSTLA